MFKSTFEKKEILLIFLYVATQVFFPLLWFLTNSSLLIISLFQHINSSLSSSLSQDFVDTEQHFFQMQYSVVNSDSL